MSDLISRQAAIDAHCELCGDRDKCNCDICPDVEVFQSLPPAEPNCSEIPNNSDCISRQAAITAIQKAYADTEGGTDKCAVWKNVGLTNALHIMQDLPSAQPQQRWIPCGKCIHADGKHRWCKILDRSINEDYFCCWAKSYREEGGK